jgi:hypothetical protein
MNNVEAMTPVQPGSYKVLHKDAKTGEFSTYDVVAIVAFRAEGGWIEYEPVFLVGMGDLHTPPNEAASLTKQFEYYGMARSDEVEAEIARLKVAKPITL